MDNKKTFQTVLNAFRKYAFSERDKGDKFERLMQAYLQTDPYYANRFKKCLFGPHALFAQNI